MTRSIINSSGRRIKLLLSIKDAKCIGTVKEIEPDGFIEIKDIVDRITIL